MTNEVHEDERIKSKVEREIICVIERIRRDEENGVIYLLLSLQT